ncbi:MAG: hypothetical protein ACT4NL_09290 [Pseudomarimonas sp.]
MRSLFCASLALVALAFAAESNAMESTLGFGIADAHDHESANVVDLSLRWPTSGRFKLIDEHEVLVGWVESRPLPHLDDDTLFAGYGFRSNFGRWFTGGGIMVVDHTTEALSSWYQFVSTGGVHIGRASLTLRHISNSGFKGRNRGETYLSLGFDW